MGVKSLEQYNSMHCSFVIKVIDFCFFFMLKVLLQRKFNYTVQFSSREKLSLTSVIKSASSLRQQN